MKQIVIVETGTANLASVVSMFEKLGANCEGSSCPEKICSAEYIVLPGVGSFGTGMARLRDKNLAPVLNARVRDRRPTLAVCLGLQLLAASSDETPGEPGLGVVNSKVEKFTACRRVPQLGWNRVRACPGSRYLEDGYAYFANSYCLKAKPDGFVSSSSDYGEEFVAAFEDGGVLACQFHPELSGKWGLKAVERWLNGAQAAGKEVTCSQNA